MPGRRGEEDGAAENGRSGVVGTRVTRDALAELVRDWQAARLSNEAIADRFLELLASDAAWSKTFGHPLRGQILELLRSEGSISPVQASDRLETSVASLSYHFRVLSKLGAIEVDQLISRRGAVEHVYRLTGSG